MPLAGQTTQPTKWAPTLILSTPQLASTRDQRAWYSVVAPTQRSYCCVKSHKSASGIFSTEGLLVEVVFQPVSIETVSASRRFLFPGSLVPSLSGKNQVKTAAYRCIFSLTPFQYCKYIIENIDIHINKFAPVDPDNIEVEDTDEVIAMETPEDVNDKDQKDPKDPIPCI